MSGGERRAASVRCEQIAICEACVRWVVAGRRCAVAAAAVAGSGEAVTRLQRSDSNDEGATPRCSESKRALVSIRAHEPRIDCSSPLSPYAALSRPLSLSLTCGDGVSWLSSG